MARLLDGRYARCEKIIVVCDNLNTHTKGAFYEAFKPERARHLVRRIEFRHTPKHGSWLNIAENELSSLTRQCVAGRRFGDGAQVALGNAFLDSARDRRSHRSSVVLREPVPDDLHVPLALFDVRHVGRLLEADPLRVADPVAQRLLQRRRRLVVAP